MQTQGLAAFVDDLSGGLILVSLSVVIGAIAWGLVVLRGSREGRELLQRCLALMRIGALALAAAQAVKIIAKAGVVAASLDAFPWTDYAATAQFQASLARVVLALMIAACARLPLRTRSGWPVLTALAVALMLSGAWLIHGAGRLEARAPLMALTVLHQLAAAIWVGGVIQLLALWHRSRGTELQSFWPIAIARFSSLGIAAVALLLATGVTLAWHYVGSWQGLLGTGYGSLVLAKTWLLAVTLAFAGLNFFRGPALTAESDQRCGRRARAVSDRSRSVPAGRSPVPCGKRIVAAAGSGHSRSDRQLPRGGADVRTEDAAAGHPDTPRLSHRRGGAQRAGRQAAVCSGHAMVGLQPQHRRFVSDGDGYRGAAVLRARIRLGPLLAIGIHGAGRLSVLPQRRRDLAARPGGLLAEHARRYRSPAASHRHCSGVRARRAGSALTGVDADPSAPAVPVSRPVCIWWHPSGHARPHAVRDQARLPDSVHPPGHGTAGVDHGRGALARAALADARLQLESKAAGVTAVLAMLLIGLILVFYREPL